ncbi:MAG: SurA N-terminal domain-containing protein [Rubrivivax sp.]|nr:SurA N-terminal domain-containing protein [Rubrivivax sp.]
MFDFVRTHTRLALGFMLLLIIPSFVFFGVQGYSSFNDATNDTVAKVDGQAIKRAEWDDAHKRQVDNFRRQAPGIDVSMFDTPQLRRETLDGLMRERLLIAAAQQLNLFPSDARMQRLFDSDPQYASLRGPDGRISREALAGMGMTPQLFDQRLRQDMGVRQVLSGITQTVPAAALPATAALNAFMERRAVQLQRFDPVAFREKVAPTDAELEAYFKANESTFRLPEQASIEYVQLDFVTIGRNATITEEDLRKAYEDKKSSLVQAEERRASHILIGADKDKPSAERAKAKARAEALLAEVRKNPVAFAELAKKNSTDSGSAVNGGDLDFFGRGMMVKPFEDTAFAMKPGQISDVVETDFGYHIIQLTAVRGGTAKPFEEVRPELESELRKAAATKGWGQAAETFTDLAYNQSSSLQPIVDKLKLEKKTATVSRKAPAGASGPLASQKLLDAIFSNEVVRDKRNTDGIEVGPNQLVAARVVKHEPARLPALAEVKDRVREKVVEQQAAALARKEGEARLAAVRGGAGNEALPTVLTISRPQSQGLPQPLLEAALKADPAKLPYVTGVDLGAQGYFVLRVMQVLPRETPPGGEESLRAQYAQAWAAAEADAYLGALKKRFKAEVKPAADAVVPAASGPDR